MRVKLNLSPGKAGTTSPSEGIASRGWRPSVALSENDAGVAPSPEISQREGSLRGGSPCEESPRPKARPGLIKAKAHVGRGSPGGGFKEAHLKAVQGRLWS